MSSLEKQEYNALVEVIESLTIADFEGCLETVERILSEMELFETEAGQ